MHSIRRRIKHEKPIKAHVFFNPFYPKLLSCIINWIFNAVDPDFSGEIMMNKWLDEEYSFEIEVTGYLHPRKEPKGYCRNGEEIGDRYSCTYGCPVNEQGYGICSKTMMMLYPIMEAVRSGGDLRNIGGADEYTKDLVCPDGCVIFRLTAKKREGFNPFTDNLFESGGQ